MSKSSHFMQLKQINIDLVKEALKANTYSTKMSISEETGLSIATCGNILSELLVTGEVVEVELEASTGGRPARRFAYNENYASVAAVYFRKEGDTDIMVCVVANLLGEPLYENTIEDVDISLERIEAIIDALIEAYPNMKVLSLGIPGVIHQGNVGYSHFKSLSYYPLEERLMEKYNLLVIAENDNNATVTGFYNSYVKDKPESLAYLYYQKDGLSGSGIIVNGKIVKGHTNFAGEVSFLPLSLNRQEQEGIQSDPEKFSAYVCKVVASINCIINPEKIVLSGYYFTQPLADRILSQIGKWIPKAHVPELIFETNPHKSYLKGLIDLALDQLRCNIEIVER